MSRKRPILVVQGYTFAQTTSDTRYWNCSNKMSRNCKAKLKFDSIFLTYYTLMPRNSPVLMVQGYTFAQTTSDSRYWNCSKKKSRECKAKLKFDNSHHLVDYYLKHNHVPPKYIVDKSGQRIQLHS
ncbi:unnamed protein product, partial [Iphiclides podalirius]